MGDCVSMPMVWHNPNLSNKVYRVRQIIDIGTIIQSTAVQTGGIAFTLSSLDQASTFTSLFDQYKIAYAKVKFRPVYNMVSPNITTAVPPLLYTVIDYDNAAAPGSIAQMRQYNTVKETKFSVDHVRCLQPRVATAAYIGSTPTGFANQIAWIDCASSAVSHYGVKWLITAAGSGTSFFQWSVEIELFLEFRMTI
jgi:hypothetical protein